jgi:O-antigen ligase
VLGYAAIQKAGVDPADWNACMLAVGVVVAVYGISARGVELGKIDRLIGICLLVILGLAAVQIVPLPIEMVHRLSPTRFELYEATARLAGAHAHTITLSATPYKTAEYLLTLCGYGLLMLFVAHLRRQTREFPWASILPLLAISGFEAALACYQAYSGTPADTVSGTYRNRDHFAALLEMALPFALIYPFSILRRDRDGRESPIMPAVKAFVAIAIFVLLLIGIILSLSRMAFIAALAAVFVVLAAVITTRDWRNSTHDRIRPWRQWMAVGAVAALILVGFIYLPTDPLVARFADLASTEKVSADVRAQIWRNTTSLIKDYPLFGCGLGSYASCFLRYKTVAPMNTVDFAHNDYLQVLAELGLFGFCAGLLLVARVLLCAIRATLYARSGDERYISIACLGSMVAILLHSFVDFNMYVPANAFECAWIIGIAAMYTNSRAQAKAQTRETAALALNAA